MRRVRKGRRDMELRSLRDCSVRRAERLTGAPGEAAVVVVMVGCGGGGGVGGRELGGEVRRRGFWVMMLQGWRSLPLFGAPGEAWGSGYPSILARVGRGRLSGFRMHANA